MFRDRRFVVALFLIAALGVLVGGCGSSDSSSGGATGGGSSEATAADGGGSSGADSDGDASGLESIAYAGITDESPQFREVGDLLEALAEEEGIEFSKFDNKLDAGTALQNARLMVQLDPDVLIDWSATADANIAIGKQFTASGTPCIAANIPIEGCAWFNHMNRLVGVEEAEAAAKVAKEKGWTGDDTTLLIVNFPEAGPEVNSLSQNFYSVFAEQFPEMEQVKPSEISPTTTKIGDYNAVFVDGKGATEPTADAVRAVLPSIPGDKNLIVNVLSDESGLGAKRALEQGGREDALIVGTAASSVGLKELRTNPNWIAEGSVFFGLWPKYLLAMAKALQAGAELPELTRAPQLVLTKENVDEYYGPDGEVKKDPPIPAPSKYLEEYGLSEE